MARAKNALERFGLDYFAPPYSRGFDSFEMNDGMAVVCALMRHAVGGNVYLERGIRSMGGLTWELSSNLVFKARSSTRDWLIPAVALASVRL